MHFRGDVQCLSATDLLLMALNYGFVAPNAIFRDIGTGTATLSTTASWNTTNNASFHIAYPERPLQRPDFLAL